MSFSSSISIDSLDQYKTDIDNNDIEMKYYHIKLFKIICVLESINNIFYWIRSDYSAASFLTPRNVPEEMYQCTRCRNVPRNLLGLKFQIQTLLDKTINLSNRIEQLELALEDSFFEKNEIEKSEYKQKYLAMNENYFFFR